MEFVRCRYPQVRYYIILSRRYNTHLTCTSIVEANVAIKVACMPACASFFRHLHSRLQSYVNTRFSYTKASKATSTTQYPKVIEKTKKPKYDLKPRYWRFRDRRPRDEGPPQITSVTAQSDQGHGLSDLNTTDTKSSREAETPVSMDLSSSQDEDQKLPERDDIV